MPSVAVWMNWSPNDKKINTSDGVWRGSQRISNMFMKSMNTIITINEFCVKNE